MDTVVADDCLVFANGYQVEDESLDRNAGLLVEGLREFHKSFPDLRLELYDEVQEDEGKHTKIAIRFVFSATIDDRPHTTEVGVFLTVDGKRLIEWREVVDMSLFNARRAGIGLEPIG